MTEVQPDTGNLQSLKFGMPPVMLNNTIDQAHSVHYAVGYMFEQIQPRLAMVTHLSYDEELVPEIVAGIRHHYNGLFQFGAPDVVVVNVNKDSVWTRKAVIPDAGNMARPTPREAAELFDLSPTNLTVTFPTPRCRMSDNLDAEVYNREIDPREYYPSDLYREPHGQLPGGLLDRRPRGRPPEAASHAGEAQGQGRPAVGRRRRHRADRQLAGRKEQMMTTTQVGLKARELRLHLANLLLPERTRSMSAKRFAAPMQPEHRDISPSPFP